MGGEGLFLCGRDLERIAQFFFAKAKKIGCGLSSRGEKYYGSRVADTRAGHALRSLLKAAKILEHNMNALRTGARQVSFGVLFVS